MKYINGFIVLLLIAAMVACHDYSVLLPNGYRIVNIGGDDRIIVDSDNIVVTDDETDGTVDLYAVKEDYVVGKLVSYNKDGFTVMRSKYFFIDTKNRTLKKELTRHQLNGELARLGIVRIKMRRPSYE